MKCELLICVLLPFTSSCTLACSKMYIQLLHHQYMIGWLIRYGLTKLSLYRTHVSVYPPSQSHPDVLQSTIHLYYQFFITKCTLGNI